MKEYQKPLPDKIHLSSWSRLLAFLFGCLAIYGLLFKSFIPLLLGLGGWTVMLMMLLQFRLHLDRAVRSSSFSLGFKLDEQSYRAGSKNDIFLTAQGIQGEVYLSRVLLHHSVYIEPSDGTFQNRQILTPQKDFETKISCSFPVAGRFCVHGATLFFADRLLLFSSQRYFQSFFWVRVLPSIPLSYLQKGRFLVKKPLLQQSGAPDRRTGTGTDLKDIREYQPGDSRRSIVWKHSLRHRKLLCREFESEVPISAYILLDIGQSMREGKLGHRKLDHAETVVSSFTKQALKNRDGVGLISFDGEIFRHDRVGHKKSQLHQVLKHLESLHRITDPHFSAMPLIDLCELVSLFLFQEGLLAADSGLFPASPRDVVGYVWDYLQAHPDIGFPEKWGSQKELIRLVLRRFCSGVGLELPYRYHQWVTHKSGGLQTAIEMAVAKLHGGQMIIIISDLGDVLNWEGILKALRLARLHRHQVVFLSPFSPWFSEHDKVEDKTRKTLREILSIERWAWRKRVQGFVAPMGIPVLSVDPVEAPQILLKRLKRLKLSGR